MTPNSSGWVRDTPSKVLQGERQKSHATGPEGTGTSLDNLTKEEIQDVRAYLEKRERGRPGYYVDPEKVYHNQAMVKAYYSTPEAKRMKRAYKKTRKLDPEAVIRDARRQKLIEQLKTTDKDSPEYLKLKMELSDIRVQVNEFYKRKRMEEKMEQDVKGEEDLFIDWEGIVNNSIGMGQEGTNEKTIGKLDNEEGEGLSARQEVNETGFRRMSETREDDVEEEL